MKFARWCCLFGLLCAAFSVGDMAASGVHSPWWVFALDCAAISVGSVFLWAVPSE